MNEPINRYIDHSVLKPEYSRQQAIERIELGLKYDVRTVCVRPCDIRIAQKIIAGSDTALCCVLAFPHGDALPQVKSEEAKCYVGMGVNEIDMVVNYSLIKSGLWGELEDDIRAVTRIAQPARVAVKAILETAALTIEETILATKVAVAAEADFVKTSTGFGPGGATKEAVQTMLNAAQGMIQVKASGGIRDRKTAEMFIALGVTRLGVGSASTASICESRG